MKRFSPLLLLLTVFYLGCSDPSGKDLEKAQLQLFENGAALLTTRFKSYEEFNSEVQIEYKKGKKPWVRLTHNNNGKVVGIKTMGFRVPSMPELFNQLKRSAPYLGVKKNKKPVTINYAALCQYAAKKYPKIRKKSELNFNEKVNNFFLTHNKFEFQRAEDIYKAFD